jgi:hypothetical protein
VIEIILAEDATARHLARKLWIYFAGTEPDPKLERALAHTLRARDYDLKWFLRRMFLSDAFYDASVQFQRVKSPTEFLVGSCRLLEIDVVDGRAATRALANMGQQLFQPPNVKGWDGGLRWINASTLTARYDTAWGMLYGTRGRTPPAPMVPDVDNPVIRDMLAATQPTPAGDQPPYDPSPLLRRYKLDTAETIVDHFVMRLLQRPLAPADRDRLVGHVRRVGRSLDPDDPHTGRAVRGLIHMILCLPEYQLS